MDNRDMSYRSGLGSTPENENASSSSAVSSTPDMPVPLRNVSPVSTNGVQQVAINSTQFEHNTDMALSNENNMHAVPSHENNPCPQLSSGSEVGPCHVTFPGRIHVIQVQTSTPVVNSSDVSPSTSQNHFTGSFFRFVGRVSKSNAVVGAHTNVNVVASSTCATGVKSTSSGALDVQPNEEKASNRTPLNPSCELPTTSRECISGHLSSFIDGTPVRPVHVQLLGQQFARPSTIIPLNISPTGHEPESSHPAEAGLVKQEKGSSIENTLGSPRRVKFDKEHPIESSHKPDVSTNNTRKDLSRSSSATTQAGSNSSDYIPPHQSNGDSNSFSGRYPPIGGRAWGTNWGGNAPYPGAVYDNDNVDLNNGTFLPSQFSNTGYQSRGHRAQLRAQNCRRRPSPYERSQLITQRALLNSRRRKYQRLIRELDCALHPEYCHYADHSDNLRAPRNREYGSCRCSAYLDTSSDED